MHRNIKGLVIGKGFPYSQKTSGRSDGQKVHKPKQDLTLRDIKINLGFFQIHAIKYSNLDCV